MLHAERIGHGYHVLGNPGIYRECLEQGIHFEMCPHSSLLTGSVKMQDLHNHPVIRFAEDGANFSINTDAPSISGCWIGQEFDIVRSWGLPESHLTTIVSNLFLASSLKSCIFQQAHLPDNHRSTYKHIHQNVAPQ